MCALLVSTELVLQVQNQTSITKIDGVTIWILDVDGQRIEISTDGLIGPRKKDCGRKSTNITINQRAWQTRYSC